MFQAEGLNIPSPLVHTTSHRGFTPEELADHSLDKIVSVSASISDPMVKAQAEAYKEHIRGVLVECMKKSINSYKTTLIAELTKAGHEDMAQIIRTI